MAALANRKLDLPTMLQHVRQVVTRGKAGDPPAFTLILGAGASYGVVPTARQMLGLSGRDGLDAKCIPAFLYDRENGGPIDPTALEGCVHDFWQRLTEYNKGRCSLNFDNGLPTAVSDAYKFLFSQEHTGGLNSPGDAREYLRYVTMGTDGRVRLNGTHFFLGSLLSLQNRTPDQKGAAGRPLYVGRRPLARTIFTTNFDPLLQVSLQLFQNLYYMTDRPELLAADGLHTDDHPALHLFYAHGSVHRPFLANTDNEIAKLRDANYRALAPYFATHGVIVLGYSGWDDCLLRALQQTASFRHNLYWLTRGEASISDAVGQFLLGHTNAKWVPITDAGDFMAALHRELCPGVAMTELLANPIAPLRERLGRVDLTGIEASAAESSDTAISTAEKAITPEDLRRQVVELLGKMEQQFTEPSADDALLVLQKLEHQADLAYANRDWPSALELNRQLAEHPNLTVAAKTRALVSTGRCHSELGRTAEAIAEYTRAIELPGAPPDQVARALFNRGNSHARAGRNAEAIADYTRVIELPGVTLDQVARALVNRGNSQGRAGRNSEAIADYTRVIELPGASPERLAYALVNRGVTHEQAGRTAEAIIDYTRVIELPGAPPDKVAKALVNRGGVHDRAGRSAEEIADYTRVIELTGAPPDQVGIALFDRGLAHEQAGRDAEAIADYTGVIDLPGASPDHVAMALINRGGVHERAGRSAEVIADYTRVIDLHGALPDQIAIALVNRGGVYERAGRSVEAIADCTRVIDLPGALPDQVAMALVNRGGVHERAGRSAEAIADYTGVIDLPGAPPDQVSMALFSRGGAHQRAGRSAEAIADYARVIELPDASSALLTQARTNFQLLTAAEESPISQTAEEASKPSTGETRNIVRPPRAED